MIILDTDVLSLLQSEDAVEAIRVRARIAQVPTAENVSTTIITYHEQSRGWLVYLAKARTRSQLIYAYELLEAHVEHYQNIRVVSYDEAAADRFEDLRASHRRLGVADLRIAAIALSRDALLVTRNLKDFGQIAGLRVEDWTKP
jgi:tRNA(fMet)-specific endonuclease VapC